MNAYERHVLARMERDLRGTPQPERKAPLGVRIVVITVLAAAAWGCLALAAWAGGHVIVDLFEGLWP